MMILDISVIFSFETHKAVKEFTEAAKQGKEAVKEWQERYSEYQDKKEKSKFRLNLT